jgi:hypothetical protein
VDEDQVGAVIEPGGGSLAGDGPDAIQGKDFRVERRPGLRLHSLIPSPPLRSSLTQAIVGASVFLVVIVALVVTGRTPWWVLARHLVLSAVTFMLYGWDKVSAGGGHRRTPEKTLNGLAHRGN